MNSKSVLSRSTQNPENNQQNNQHRSSARAARSACAARSLWPLAWIESRICLAALAVLLLASAVSAAQSAFPATAVGTQAAQQAVIVVAQAAGTVDHATVLTLGQPQLDFTVPGVPASSCAGVTLTVGGATPSCSQSLGFKPTAPGV